MNFPVNFREYVTFHSFSREGGGGEVRVFFSNGKASKFQ